MRRDHPLRPAPAGLLALAFLAGCIVPVESREDGGMSGTPTPGPLRVDANGFPAAEGTEAAAAPAALLSAVDRLLAAGRTSSARLRVRRFPDLALAVLCGIEGTGPSMQFVARIHEEQCGDGGAGGWAALDPRERSDYARARTAWLADREGPAPDGAPGVLLLDGLRLRGITLLVEDRPAEAADVLERAVASAGEARPWEAAHLLLIEAEARRREGSSGQESWASSVERAARAAAPPRQAVDPGFWERALQLRPEGAPWPESARAWMLDGAERFLGWKAPPGMEPPLDAVLRGILGHIHLSRGESREALLSFSRGQEGDLPAGLRERLRLGQARALLQAGEAEAGRALLGSLSAGAAPAAAAEALAILGAIEIRGGRRELGTRMLQEALAPGLLPDGPARNRAEANLALVLLMSGRPEEGLRMLRAVQSRWESAGELEEISISLENEILHYERSGNATEAEGIRTRLRALEAGPSR